MKKTVLLFLSALFLFSFLPEAISSGAPPNESSTLSSFGDFVPGEILVKFRPHVRLSSLARYQSSHALFSIQTFSTIGVERLKLPQGMEVDSALKIMRMDPAVEYVEPNYIYRVTAVPNDPYFGLMWGLHNTGQNIEGTAGISDADMDAVEAWDRNTGRADIVVAVIDSGVYAPHPDLLTNIWVNPGEIPGNGIDDDLNGLVDDVNGWDFLFWDNIPNDANGHGTHVAGTIAAAGNNGVGVTGVSWNAKIMVLRAFDKDGFGSLAAQINSILYANAMGAHIINNSWGGYNYSQSLKDAIDASPAVIVCAAGNGESDGIGDNNDELLHYPSSYDSANIIAVAATNQNDVLASFSNFGPASVDVAAPGTNILSTANDGTYAYLSGTSMATPHVSGLAALLWGYAWSSTTENRLMTTVNIVSRIKSTVDPLPSLSGLIATGGRINAARALGSGGEDDDDGGGGCFIATAAYGSYSDPHVRLLRAMRDRFLKTSAAGRIFIDFYYRHSPDWASFLRKSPKLQWAVRTALLPIVGFSWVALKTGIHPAGVLLFTLGFLTFAVRFEKNRKKPYQMS